MLSIQDIGMDDDEKTMDDYLITDGCIILMECKPSKADEDIAREEKEKRERQERET